MADLGSKIGIHSIRPARVRPLMQAAKDRGVRFKVVKSVDSPGTCIEAKQIDPEIITIARFVWKDWDSVQGIENWPPDMIDNWAEMVVDACWDRMNHDERRASDFIETTNEADPPGVVGWRKLGLYCLAMVRRADRLGLKICLPAFNAGTPEYEEMKAFLESGVAGAMKAGGHIFAIHEGVFGKVSIDFGFGDSIPGAPSVAGAGSMIGRYRYFYHLLEERNEVVPCVISEAYTGDHYSLPHEQQLERFKWMDKIYRRDPYILGWLPFTIDPSDGWTHQDYTPVFDSVVVDYLVQEKDVPNVTQPLPAPQPTPIPSPVPPVSGLVGLHGRADGRMEPADWQVIDIAKIEAVKLLTTAAYEDAARAVQDGKFVMVRLFADFSNRFISPGDFAMWHMLEVEKFRAAGVRYYEVHNEPNLISEGLGKSWNNGTGFNAWFIQVYNLLKARFPDCQFGFPGVSPGLTSPGERMSEWLFLDQCRLAIALSDFMCQHVYWQSDLELTELESSPPFAHYHEFAPTKPLFITEFAHQHDNASEGAKGAEYVRFYNLVKKFPYIGAAFAFVSSASHPDFKSQSWRGENGVLTLVPWIVGDRDNVRGTHRVVNASLLNVRAHPWSGDVVPPLVRQLKGGDAVTVHGVYKTPAMAVGWACLSDDGNEWVSLKYLAAL